MRPRAPARGRKLRAERGPAYLCGQRPRFFLSQGEVLPAPILFSAAQPPRPFWAEPTSVGVRRREPVCQATGVYSIKRGPRCAARSGEQRERAAGAVQERTRQGDNRGISAEMQCGTASRAARDFTGEPCSPVNPFFLDGGFWLGESASRKLSGGVGGAFWLPEEQKASKPPTIFLWYRQAAPSLSKKEMVGPTVPASAACEKFPSPPVAGTLRPLPFGWIKSEPRPHGGRNISPFSAGPRHFSERIDFFARGRIIVLLGHRPRDRKIPRKRLMLCIIP